MSDISYDEALAHFGVKGMRWGVRKKTGPVAKTGLGGQLQRHATRTTQGQIELHKKALTGEGITGMAAKLDKYTWGGGGRFEGYHNKRISQLERSKERIATGELIAKTVLFGPQYSKAPKASKS